MILTPDQIKSRLRRLGVAADKHLGQHFLIDNQVLAAIVGQVEKISPRLIVEVGPGLGGLTEELVKLAPTIAVERDPVLAKKLQQFVSSKQLTVIQGGILEIFDTNREFPFKFQSGLYSPMVAPGTMHSVGDAHVLPTSDWAVAANIPYAITSPLIRKVLECPVLPKAMVLMVQKEVADRLSALPPSPDRGLLTVIVETMGVVETVSRVSPKAFWPAPTVESAIVRLDVAPKFHRDTRETIIRLAAWAFAGKRKMIANSLLSSGEEPADIKKRLRQAGIDPSARPQTLQIGDWQSLADAWK